MNHIDFGRLGTLWSKQSSDQSGSNPRSRKNNARRVLVISALMVAALAVYMPVGIALGVALTSRLIFTVADILAASAAALSGVRALRR